MHFTNISKAVVGAEFSLVDKLSTHRFRMTESQTIFTSLNKRSMTEKKTTKRADTMEIRRQKS